MAGKISDGNDASLQEIRNSRAYNEGMEHRAADTATNNPITDNPYDGEGTEEETAWDAGWNAADAYAGSAMPASAMESCSVTTPIPAAI